MKPVLTAAQMREADRAASAELGLPGMLLMENAGAAVARVIEERFPKAARVAVVCGKGNNGGDGFVVARRLLERRPAVFLIGSRAEVVSDAALHLAALERCGCSIVEVADAAAWRRVRNAVIGADLVVDALFGTGLRETPRGLPRQVIAALGRRQRKPVIALDVPSGILSDSVSTPVCAVRASITVTFGALKPALVFEPAAAYAGQVLVADIGIPAVLMQATKLFVSEARDAAAAWGARSRGSHKGTQGHVLVVAGSAGKSGAAVLAGSGALRAGAGLATVATAASALPRVAARRPELMAEALPVSKAGGLSSRGVARALELARVRDAVILGPGLGQDAATRAFIEAFAAECPVPLVIDADGLNALASRRDAATRLLKTRRASTVLTPHPGEMGRLARRSTKQVQSARLETALGLASASGAVVVLKGYQSIVAEPSGRAAMNPTGNPGLATAGSGDVLAGVVGALLARGCGAWTAATAAVYVHGLGGDQLAVGRGVEGILAGEIAEALPGAIRAVQQASSERS